MSVPDEKTGEYRKDMKVLHLSLLQAPTDGEIGKLETILEETFKAKGLDREYVLVVTGPEISVHVEQVQTFIDRLSNDATALKSSSYIDLLIKKLQQVREKRWQNQPAQPLSL